MFIFNVLINAWLLLLWNARYYAKCNVNLIWNLAFNLWLLNLSHPPVKVPLNLILMILIAHFDLRIRMIHRKWGIVRFYLTVKMRLFVCFFNFWNASFIYLEFFRCLMKITTHFILLLLVYALFFIFDWLRNRLRTLNIPEYLIWTHIQGGVAIEFFRLRLRFISYYAAFRDVFLILRTCLI